MYVFKPSIAYVFESEAGEEEKERRDSMQREEEEEEEDGEKKHGIFAQERKKRIYIQNRFFGPTTKKNPLSLSLPRKHTSAEGARKQVRPPN